MPGLVYFEVVGEQAACMLKLMSIARAGTWQDRRVAIKVLSTQGSKARGFEVFSECLVAERVRHPNVVRHFPALALEKYRRLQFGI